MRQVSLRYGLKVVAILAVLLPARGLSAQAPDSMRHCDGLTVDSVDVETNRPAFKGAMAWWQKLARSVGLHHQTTAQGVVRRFVSLDPGKECTEFRRSESQRILRAQPYIADATVTTTQIDDGARVDVSTVDEVSAVGSARLRGSSVQALSLGTLNFRGAGMHVEGRWEAGRAYRDGFGAKLVHHQLLGRPYTLDLEGARHPVGEYSSASLSHPFLTDLQRIAWHAGYLTSKEFAHLRRPDRVELVQPVDRWMWNVGGVVRFGPPRRLGLIGGMVLGERLVPQHEFSIVDSTSGGLIPPTTTDTVGVRKYPSYDATHVAGVLGLRALTFTRMRGLDALAAEQDIGTGTQVGAMLGLRPFFSTPLRDAFASVDAYFAGRSRRTFSGARIEVESRLDLERRSWQHLIASGRGAWYFKPTERWVSELSLEGAAGWRPILPFQLELGDRQSGVRGYAQSREPGAQRLIARFEQRVDLARYRVTRAAIGAVVFTDAGRTWGGAVPFGIDTPVRVSVGAGILAAVPANSQRTIRAELALPLTRTTGARPEVRFIVREPARGFWYEPRRIRWARLSAVPEQIFSWP
jgi:hypothetical protein